MSGHGPSFRNAGDPLELHAPATPPKEYMPYAEAERLLALYRAKGPDALTPQQHDDIWDCLLAQPASQAVLEAMLEEAQAGMPN